jgi:hypothetical protein
VALYWYMSHGRVAASEYAGKAYLIYDAIRYRRSDAALVRIVSPVLSGESDDAVAGRRGIEFAQALFPSLEAYLPF